MGSCPSGTVPRVASIARVAPSRRLRDRKRFHAMVSHRMSMRKLGRTTAHRLSMLRTMVSQLLEHERIKTTLPKAKELRRVADKMVSLGKKGTLHSRRQAERVVRGKEVLQKLFGEMAERYREREGGYVRVLHAGRRNSDSAPMAFIEFVDRPGEFRPARPPRAMAQSFASSALPKLEKANSQ